MDILLYCAAALLIFIGIAHSYLGEKYILIRLFRRDDLPKIFGSPDFTIKTLRFAWHITTVAWFGFAAIVIHLASDGLNKSFIAYVIGVTFFIHFLIALIGSKGKHLSWIIFLLISLGVLTATF
ncbi:MAG: hypothetical protein OQK51_15270 [Kangiellaceae bacterium]|nr:hypothetical protein [Kangiellaceae bacterium]